jgi:hypothetical protein
MYNGGNSWSYWISHITFLRDVGGLNLKEHKNFDSFDRLANNSGPRMMHAKFCIVSEKPEFIKTEIRNNVHVAHSLKGPSHKWRDGFALHYLNGVRVPAWFINQRPSSLDPRMVLKIENADQRREFVRLVGIERICYSLGAVVVDKEGDYELLNLDLGDGRQRPYLKMLNPSIGTWHVEGVPPGTTTVGEALAFRNGLTKDKIDDKNGKDWYQQGDVILREEGKNNTKFKSRPIQLT